MQKIGRAFAQTAGRLLFLGISVQILLGIGWMVRSFGIFPEFGDSYLWLKAAETLVCDDYMGIGYPLFLMLAKGIESVSSIPYTFFVYTVQLLFAFYSGAVFLRACGITKNKAFLCWGSLGLLTFPSALQCHLAVLPNSIGYSFLLLELAAVFGILRQDAKAPDRPLYHLFLAGIWWCCSAAFVAENRYLGLVPLILLWLIHLCHRPDAETGRKRAGQELVLLAAMTGLLFTLVSLWQTPGSYGKAENTLSAAMMRRCSWTHMRLEKEFNEWPEEVRQYLDWDDVKRAGYYAGTMGSSIQKQIEDAAGAAEAQKLFRQCALYHLKTYTSDNIHQIVWDCAGYALPTVMLQLFLDGRGYDTFSGRNVDIMMTGDLRLPEVLLKYSSWWFLVGIVTLLLMAVVLLLLTGKKNRTLLLRILGICAVTALGMILWYALQDAGTWDYKNGLLPGSLWLVGMLLCIDRTVVCREK